MTTLHYTVGLPGSGKTTWAREFVFLAAGPVVRVNRDDLRQMLHEGTYSLANEGVVRKMQESMIYTALQANMDVVVDDTNLNARTRQNLHDIVKDLRGDLLGQGIRIAEHSFLHVPILTCIERDAARPNSVGREVILDMWEKHLAATS